MLRAFSGALLVALAAEAAAAPGVLRRLDAPSASAARQLFVKMNDLLRF